MTEAILRATGSETVTIPINTALSSAFNLSGFAGFQIHMSAAWTAASIGFQISDSENGTFGIHADKDNNIVEVSGPVATRVYPAPETLFASPWVKLWSQISGSDEDQAAARSIKVYKKG